MRLGLRQRSSRAKRDRVYSVPASVALTVARARRLASVNAMSSPTRISRTSLMTTTRRRR